MSVKTIFVVLLAIVCGLSAAWGMTQLRSTKFVTTKQETIPVAVALVDLPRGRTVTAADVEVKEWPKNVLPEGALATPEEVVDRAVVIPVMAGEPILQAKLANKDAGRGLAALIPKGMRAYTIKASRVASNVAGFILPGDRVDVLLTLKGRYDDETGGGSTTTLLQAIEIMAVDQQLDAPAENKVDPDSLGSVTLLVTPEQASLLDLGQNMGQLTLSLRNPEDRDEADTRPATLADIRYRQVTPVAEPTSDGAAAPVAKREREAAETFDILTLRGSQRGHLQIVDRQ
ncbi:MAG: Flp pilus assembly protein CpaB [Thermoguttaceae bacterium]